MAMYSGLFHWTWWFPIVKLNYRGYDMPFQFDVTYSTWWFLIAMWNDQGAKLSILGMIIHESKTVVCPEQVLSLTSKKTVLPTTLNYTLWISIDLHSQPSYRFTSLHWSNISLYRCLRWHCISPYLHGMILLDQLDRNVEPQPGVSAFAEHRNLADTSVACFWA